MFDFKEKFKTFDSVDLFRMLAHPEKYQPDAIAAAQFILDERKNSEPEKWQAAIDHLEYEKELKINVVAETQSQQDFEDVNNIWVENEVEIKNQELAWNQVLVICFVLIVVFIKDLYFISRYIFNARKVTDGLLGVDPILVALCLINIAVVLFILKKDKIGWILLVAQSFYTLSVSLMLMCYFFYTSYYTNNFRIPFSFYTNTCSIIVYGTMLRQALQPKMVKLLHAKAKWFWPISATVVFLYACFVIGTVTGRG